MFTVVISIQPLYSYVKSNDLGGKPRVEKVPFLETPVPFQKPPVGFATKLIVEFV